MHRTTLALLFLALAACGQAPAPSASSGSNAVPAWRLPLTANPDIVHTYDRDALTTQAGATLARAPHWLLTTDPHSGQFSGVLELGAEAAAQRPMALRIRARIDRGAFQFIESHKNWAADFHPFVERVVAGPETTIWLPIDQHDANQLLIIGNGAEAGASAGEITSIELVAAPASH